VARGRPSDDLFDDLDPADEPLDDFAFDLYLPYSLRAISDVHWTPVDVCRRAVEMLREAGARRVLDVGAGAGKFCVVGALTSPLEFTGVEHRAALVGVARGVARYLRVAERARFVHGVVQDVTLTDFDALYLFNPFGESLLAGGDPIDTSVELGPARHTRDVAYVEDALGRAPVGTLVLTYHGFGGRLPEDYELLRDEPAGTDALKLWRRAPRSRCPA
jgi:SAM-dependent methyltransferase